MEWPETRDGSVGQETPGPPCQGVRQASIQEAHEGQDKGTRPVRWMDLPESEGSRAPGSGACQRDGGVPVSTENPLIRIGGPLNPEHLPPLNAGGIDFLPDAGPETGLIFRRNHPTFIKGITGVNRE